MNENEYYIKFKGLDKQHWIDIIIKYLSINIDANKKIIISINNINTKYFEPVHLVLLACLRQHLKNCGHEKCFLTSENKEIKKYLINDINLNKYWLGENTTNYTESKNETIFNLWRINESEELFYTENISNYLTNHYFKNKDLSAVKESLLEAYYNIFDHAKANGNAFSLIKYNKENKKLYVAICDMGKGIAKNIRDFFPEIKTDKDAIKKATLYNITTQSKPHNGGKGITNIINHLQEEDTLKIISNKGFLSVKNNNYELFDLNSYFPGTLLYYEVSLNHFEDNDMLDNFEIDF